MEEAAVAGGDGGGGGGGGCFATSLFFPLTLSKGSVRTMGEVVEQKEDIGGGGE